ncbi:uncharacterized protein BDZ99DRAFT_518632 [Mytilinidion resinicola]|uniref:Uncharacterized protein n=1 Tax=Mytilinidion resinicola TaxID=574789 RepID=A0A6A6YSK8_9PEZI|nr:uncharacterized protein BDZ99DRAFT_518632 [Mytilinidion resinicola]KAF2811353.1 hypothetical protein BDZ99DRAFT_518632 [Mytilinidion resinicola]
MASSAPPPDETATVHCSVGSFHYRVDRHVSRALLVACSTSLEEKIKFAESQATAQPCQESKQSITLDFSATAPQLFDLFTTWLDTIELPSWLIQREDTNTDERLRQKELRERELVALYTFAVEHDVDKHDVDKLRRDVINAFLFRFEKGPPPAESIPMLVAAILDREEPLIRFMAYMVALELPPSSVWERLPFGFVARVCDAVNKLEGEHRLEISERLATREAIAKVRILADWCKWHEHEGDDREKQLTCAEETKKWRMKWREVQIKVDQEKETDMDSEGSKAFL